MLICYGGRQSEGGQTPQLCSFGPVSERTAQVRCLSMRVGGPMEGREFREMGGNRQEALGKEGGGEGGSHPVSVPTHCPRLRLGRESSQPWEPSGHLNKQRTANEQRQPVQAGRRPGDGSFPCPVLAVSHPSNFFFRIPFRFSHGRPTPHSRLLTQLGTR